QHLLISLSALFLHPPGDPRDLHSFPTRRSSDLPLWSLAPQSRDYLPGDSDGQGRTPLYRGIAYNSLSNQVYLISRTGPSDGLSRSEEHTSELQSRSDIVCRLLLEKKKTKKKVTK